MSVELASEDYARYATTVVLTESEQFDMLPIGQSANLAHNPGLVAIFMRPDTQSALAALRTALLADDTSEFDLSTAERNVAKFVLPSMMRMMGVADAYAKRDDARASWRKLMGEMVCFMPDTIGITQRIWTIKDADITGFIDPVNGEFVHLPSTLRVMMCEYMASVNMLPVPLTQDDITLSEWITRPENANVLCTWRFLRIELLADAEDNNPALDRAERRMAQILIANEWIDASSADMQSYSERSSCRYQWRKIVDEHELLTCDNEAHFLRYMRSVSAINAYETCDDYNAIARNLANRVETPEDINLCRALASAVNRKTTTCATEIIDIITSEKYSPISTAPPMQDFKPNGGYADTGRLKHITQLARPIARNLYPSEPESGSDMPEVNMVWLITQLVTIVGESAADALRLGWGKLILHPKYATSGPVTNANGDYRLSRNDAVFIVDILGPSFELISLKKEILLGSCTPDADDPLPTEETMASARRMIRFIVFGLDWRGGQATGPAPTTSA